MLGLLTLLVLAAPMSLAQGLPPLEEADDGATPLVRGAMAQATLTQGKTHSFTFATDGPGVLTLAWTQPGRAAFDRFVVLGPDNQAIDFKQPAPHQTDADTDIDADAHHLFSLVQPVTQPGRYTLRIKPAEDLTLHLGYAWIAFPQAQTPTLDIRKHPRHATRHTPALTEPAAEAQAKDPDAHTDRADASFPTRDTNHWLHGHPQPPIGHIVHRSSGSGLPKTFHFPADGPGLLTLAVRSEPDTDTALGFESHALTPKLKSHHDDDYAADPGAEQAAAYIHAPDNIAARVVPLGGGGRYALSASWLSLRGVAKPAPDQAP